MKRIAPDLSDEYRRTILRGGEVLVNVRGTLGGVAVSKPGMKDWNVSREVAVVPVDPNQADPFFLAYWIATDASQGWLTNVQKGAAYTGINIEDLRNLPVPIPEPSEQRGFVSKLDDRRSESRRLEQIYQAKLANLAGLKQSLLARAFAGDLT